MEEKGKIIYLPCNSNIGKANKEAWEKKQHEYWNLEN